MYTGRELTTNAQALEIKKLYDKLDALPSDVKKIVCLLFVSGCFGRADLYGNSQVTYIDLIMTLHQYIDNEIEWQKKYPTTR